LRAFEENGRMGIVIRNRRLLSVSILSLALIAIAALAAIGPGCTDALRRPLTGGGAVLWRIGESRNAPITPVKGREGDLALMNASIAVIVAGDAEDPRLKHRKGAIVGAFTSAAEGGELEELRPVVRVSGKEIPLEVIRVRAEKRDGAPVVVIRARSEAARLVVETRVSLSPAGPFAVLETAVENAGRAPLEALQVGERVSWPDGLTFVPGSGFVAEAGVAEGPWIGRRGRDASYALAFQGGAAIAELEFEPHGPLGAAAFTKPEPLPAGAYRTVKRMLVVVPGGLEVAAREAWTALGAALGEIRGTLSPTPAWASIEVGRAGAGPELVAEAAPDGSFDVWVPEGRYEVVARTPGGEDRVPADAAAGKIARAALAPPVPGVLRFHVTDASGRPIPARLVLRGVAPTSDPRLGPRHAARGAENVVYAAGGDGAVELPIGKYLVTATHGLEYSIASEEIAVSEGKGASLRASLARELESPGWTAADFHLHAEPSFDSSVSLPDRVTSLLTEDLGFAAATDHNVVTDYGPAIAELGAAGVLSSARGVEVTTDDPQWGHFNVWPFPAGAPIPPFSGQTPRTLFAAIRAAAPGAILQVNHPRMMEYNIGYFGIVGLDPKTGIAADPSYSPDFDALEVWNGMNNNDMGATRGNVAEWFDLLNRGYRYTATGNSDSHVLVFQWAGFPRNYVRVDDAGGPPSPEAMAAAVRAGHVQVTCGPFIALEVAGGGPGDLVRTSGGRVQIDVEVRAASWIDVDTVELWVDGELAAEGALSPAHGAGAVRGRLSLRLPLERDAWIVAIVRGDRPMTEVLPYTKLAPFAFTNPVFVDADGDGRFTAPKAVGDARGPDAGAEPDGACDGGAAGAP
jgi:hypothetical protein